METISYTKLEISIDGNIGAGKTSVLEELKRRGYITEPQRFEQINVLIDNFYKNERTSENIYVLQKKIYEIYKETWNTIYNKPYEYRFLEGIISSVNVFAVRSYEKKEISDEDYLKLQNDCNLERDGIIPHLIIYLDCHPELSKKRLENDNSRKIIELDYFEEIHLYYERFLKSTNIEILHLNVENHSIGQIVDKIFLFLENKNKKF